MRTGYVALTVFCFLSSIRFRREWFDFWLVRQDKPKDESVWDISEVFSNKRQYDLEGSSKVSDTSQGSRPTNSCEAVACIIP